MKYIQIILIAIAIISIQACNNAGSESGTDSNKKNARKILIAKQSTKQNIRK